MADIDQQTRDLLSKVDTAHETLISGGIVNPLTKGSIAEPEQIAAPGVAAPPLPKAPEESKSAKLANAFIKDTDNMEAIGYNPYAGAKERSYDASYTGANFDKYYSYGDTWKKYGFSPNRNNEELYNKNSSWSENFARGTVGMLKTAVPAFTSMLPWNAWDDNVTDVAGSNESARVHATYGDTRGGFSGFMNNLQVDAGMSFGIIAEMVAEEVPLWIGATLAAPETGGTSWGAATVESANLITKAKKLFSTAEMAEKLAKTAEELKNLTNLSTARRVWDYTKSGEFLKPLAKSITPNSLSFGKDVVEAYKRGDKVFDLATVSKGFGAFYRDSHAIAASRAEAKMEGSNVYTDMLRDKADAFYKENDHSPTAEDWKLIYADAENAAKETYNWNMPALILSNSIVLPKAMRGWLGMKALSHEAEESFAKSIVEKEAWWKTAEKTPWAAVKEKGVMDNLKSLTKLDTWKPKTLLRTGLSSIGKYTKKNLVEALQENYQDVVSGAMKDYYSSIHDSPTKAGYNDKMGAFAENFKKQFSEQGFQTFASGFFMGALVQIPEHVLFTSAPKGFTQLKNKFSETSKKKYEDNEVKREKWKKDTVEMWNAVSRNPFKYFTGSDTKYTTTKNKSDESDKGALNDDQYAFENANNETILDHLYDLHKQDHMDVILDQLRGMRNLSAKELKQAYGEVAGTDEEVKNHFNKQFDKVFEKADLLKKRFDYVNKKFVNQFNPSRFAADKTSDRYKQEVYNYLAVEEGKKHAIYSDMIFDDTINRMSSIMNTSTQDKAVAKAPASDFSILFDTNELSGTGMVNELKMLSNEIPILENGTAQDKKLAKIKREKFEALTPLYFAIQHFHSILDMDHEKEVNPKAKTDIEKLQAIQQGATVKTKKGTQVVVDKIAGEYAYIKEDGKTKRIKRKNLELIKEAKQENEVDYANRILEKHYQNYLNVIANHNDDHVFDRNAQKGFKQLRDFYRLKHDSGVFAKSINALHNPEYFSQYTQRMAAMHAVLHKESIEKNKKAYEKFLELRDTNDLLVEIFKTGAYIYPKDIIELLDNAVMPAKFYDAITYEELNPESEKFKEVTKVIEEWDEFAGKTLKKKAEAEAKAIADAEAEAKKKANAGVQPQVIPTGTAIAWNTPNEQLSKELLNEITKAYDDYIASMDPGDSPMNIANFKRYGKGKDIIRTYNETNKLVVSTAGTMTQTTPYGTQKGPTLIVPTPVVTTTLTDAKADIEKIESDRKVKRGEALEEVGIKKMWESKVNEFWQEAVNLDFKLIISRVESYLKNPNTVIGGLTPSTANAIKAELKIHGIKVSDKTKLSDIIKNLKEINAKYDAELAALGKTTVDSTDTPEQAKIKEQLKALDVKKFTTWENLSDELKKEFNKPSDKNYYYSKEDPRDRSLRVSTLKGDFVGTGDAADRGTIIDDLLRDFVAGKFTTVTQLTQAYKDNKVTNKVDESGLKVVKPFSAGFLKNLFDIFTEVKQVTDGLNLKLVSDIPTLWGVLDGQNYAGTIDLLGIAPDGSVYIIDLKTSTQDRRAHYEMTSELKKLAGDNYDNIITQLKLADNDMLDIKNLTEDEKAIVDTFKKKFEKYINPRYNSLKVYTYQDDDITQQSAYAELLRQRTGITIRSISVFPITVSYNYTKATAIKGADNKFTLNVNIDRTLFPEQELQIDNEELVIKKIYGNDFREVELETYTNHIVELSILEDKINNHLPYDQKDFKTIENEIARDVAAGVIENKEYRDNLDALLEKIQSKFIKFNNLSIGDYVIFATNPDVKFLVATKNRNKVEVYNSSISMEDWKDHSPTSITRSNMHNVIEVIKAGQTNVSQQQVVTPEEKKINEETVDVVETFLKNDEKFRKIEAENKSQEDTNKEFNDITGCES